MVEVSRVHNFVVGYLKLPAKKNQTEKSLQKDGHGELEVRRPTK